jgi:hypothetical protein
MHKKLIIQIIKVKLYVLYLFFIVLTFQSCSSWKKGISNNGNYETAIQNAIIDFSHSSLMRKNSVFHVSYYEYASGIIGVSILGDDNKIYMINGSNIFGVRMGDQYTEYKGKLFYWYDEKKGKNPNIEETLSKYGVIEKRDSLTEDMGSIRDDAQKALNYYFCKNNLSIYKKEMTSIAMSEKKGNNVICK